MICNRIKRQNVFHLEYYHSLIFQPEKTEGFDKIYLRIKGKDNDNNEMTFEFI